MTSCPHIVCQIVQRAEEVRTDGCRIGLFEWVSWSALRNVVVHMLFGKNIVNVGDVAAPHLCPQHGPVHRVAAVVKTSSNFCIAAGSGKTIDADINHYMIGIVAQSWHEICRHILEDEDQVVDGEVVSGNVGAYENPGGGLCARKCALLRNWVATFFNFVVGVTVRSATHNPSVHIPFHGPLDVRYPAAVASDMSLTTSGSAYINRVALRTTYRQYVNIQRTTACQCFFL